MTQLRAHELPPLLPILPVRNTVIFPESSVPLIVGRPKSLKAIEYAKMHGNYLLVMTQKDGKKDEPTGEELFKIGVVATINKSTSTEGDGLQLIVSGISRFEVSEFIEEEGVLLARGSVLPEIMALENNRLTLLAKEIKQLAKAILSLSQAYGAESLVKLLEQLDTPEQVANLCCTFVNFSIGIKQKLLEMNDLEEKLKILLEQMLKEKERLVLQGEIQNKMMERLSKDQRDNLLREQLKTIHEELGEESNVYEEFLKKVEEAKLPEEANKVAHEELKKLRSLTRSSPEFQIVRGYLEFLLALPWNKSSAKEVAINDVKKVLDEEHFGLEKVKKRIVQFLAVQKLKSDIKGPILCLVGPPGVGKTTLAKSVAKALGREFVRVSLGGVRDEAEIRGHRRTYIGAMPGRLIQSLKRAQVNDPLILLDEIDKVGTDFRGDPASALLEVLDPEQNESFMDHYLDIGFNLSKAFFITTANMLETVPPALRDRMEVIEMSSYSRAEKLEIAHRHLIPELLKEHGLKPEQIVLEKESILLILDHYCREAGVRNLSRKIAELFRHAAEKFAMGDFASKVNFTPELIEELLGSKRFYFEQSEQVEKPGVVTGLAWTPVGGEILPIEVTHMEGTGKLILTGSLGDVMKESAQIALSLLRAKLGKSALYKFDKSDFHIHVPSGAIPKDGPSAGVALFLSLASLVLDEAVSSKISMTGEITLTGRVLPVGGIKEKVIAAHRAGCEIVIIPRRNEADLKEIPEDVRQALKFHFIEEVSEALAVAQLNLAGLPRVPLASPGGETVATSHH